jgi:proline dehydrogenase
LVKGAYQEPASLAYPKKSDVDANFDELTKLIADYSLSENPIGSREDGKSPPVTVIATHDEARIEFAMEYCQEIGLAKSALEFQMLYGIRPGLQKALLEKGYPVRVYVPFGTEWYPYYVRRLAERPANLWFFLSNLFRSA